jgi:outer membrane lipoprotein-sorting protein
MPGEASEALRELTIVDDGTNVWSYDRVKNEYFSIPAGSLQEGSDFEDFLPDSMDTFMAKRFRSATYLAPVAKLLGEETLDFSGAQHKCFRIQVNGRTWWVDANSYRIVREDWEEGTGTIAYYETIKLGEPIADRTFQFQPPPNAQKIDPAH